MAVRKGVAEQRYKFVRKQSVCVLRRPEQGEAIPNVPSKLEMRGVVAVQIRLPRECNGKSHHRKRAP